MIYRIVRPSDGKGIYQDSEDDFDGLGFDLQGGFHKSLEGLDSLSFRPEPNRFDLFKYEHFLYGFTSMKKCLHWFDHSDLYMGLYDTDWVIKCVKAPFVVLDDFQVVFHPADVKDVQTMSKCTAQSHININKIMMENRKAHPLINYLEI